MTKHLLMNALLECSIFHDCMLLRIFNAIILSTCILCNTQKKSLKIRLTLYTLSYTMQQDNLQLISLFITIFLGLHIQITISLTVLTGWPKYTSCSRGSQNIHQGCLYQPHPKYHISFSKITVTNWFLLKIKGNKSQD